MALSRKFLSALGIEADKVDEIINAHSETVNALREEAEKAKERAEKYAGVQKELDELKAATKGKDYDALRKEYDEYKNAVEAEKAKAAKESAYREALKDANLTEKGLEKALKYADWDAIELDDDGKLKDAKNHVKAVREEWAEYVNKTGQQGANTATPPGRGGGNGGMTKDEILRIEDTTERQKAIAENHELFGF